MEEEKILHGILLKKAKEAQYTNYEIEQLNLQSESLFIRYFLEREAARIVENTNIEEDVLKKIYEDPHFYSELLEENKNSLKSDRAYQKSKLAVEQLMGIVELKGKKINNVIEYLVSECEDITPLALQKLLYYVQGFYYAFNDKFLFTDDCQAWVHGPVYPEVYHRYKDYRFNPITNSTQEEVSDFAVSEIAVLDSVVKYFGCYSGKVLERFTHSEEPWISAREMYRTFELSDEVICKEDIGKYFKSVKSNYNMINPSDIKLYAESMFIQI